MRLTDICDIERAKRDKVYPAGSVAIQVSATQGDTFFLDEDMEVQASKYAVATPKIDIEPIYLYTMVEGQMEEFIHKYKNGLNLSMDTLKYIKIPERSIHFQKAIANFIKLYDLYSAKYEKLIELEKELKKVMLDKMFV